MKYEWLDSYCLQKKGMEKDYKEEWQAARYMIRGKMFAMVGTRNSDNVEIVTVKLDPSYASVLRGKYRDVEPGYYMNKTHWNSVNLDGELPDDILKKMIDQSYQLIFESLPKKVQSEIEK